MTGVALTPSGAWAGSEMNGIPRAARSGAALLGATVMPLVVVVVVVVIVVSVSVWASAAPLIARAVAKRTSFMNILLGQSRHYSGGTRSKRARNDFSPMPRRVNHLARP